MAIKKNIKSKQHYEAALQLEKSGDPMGAIKFYQKAVATNPSNTRAWNRQMVLYRKNRSKEEEAKLIKTAIAEYQKAIELRQQDWLKANKTKAARTRELAQVLGLLAHNGLPHTEDNILEKWQTRLYLLDYRIKNARKKKSVVKKTPVQKRQTKKNA